MTSIERSDAVTIDGDAIEIEKLRDESNLFLEALRLRVAPAFHAVDAISGAAGLKGLECILVQSLRYWRG